MKKLNSGLIFERFSEKEKTPFEKLFEIFKELITHTSGDFDEAINWLRELDKEYKLTDKNYSIDDFIEDLLKKSYVKKEIDPNSYNNLNKIVITSKTEKLLREHALKQVFGNLKKTKVGNHKSKFSGFSDDTSGDFRSYQFGDSIDKISITESIKNSNEHYIND